MTHSLRIMIQEVEREIRIRRDVYPRLVTKGRYRHGEADELIRIMESVRETLVELERQMPMRNFP